MPIPLYPRYGWALVRRSAFIWLMLRGTAMWVGEPIVDPRVALVLILIVAALVFLDSHHIRERMFHANLGLAAPWIALVSIVTTTSLEVATQVITFAVVNP